MVENRDVIMRSLLNGVICLFLCRKMQVIATKNECNSSINVIKLSREGVFFFYSAIIQWLSDYDGLSHHFLAITDKLSFCRTLNVSYSVWQHDESIQFINCVICIHYSRTDKWDFFDGRSQPEPGMIVMIVLSLKSFWTRFILTWNERINYFRKKKNQ